MALNRVPGSKHYFADDSGFRQILATEKAGAAVLAAASVLALQAGSKYEAAPSTVFAGWANERRAGAVVRSISATASDARDRTLLNAAAAMGRRGHV